MECPQCKKRLPNYFFEANFSGNLTCYNCGRKFTIEYAQANMEFSDCRLAREFGFDLGEFERDHYCCSCYENCIFAAFDDSDFIGMEKE